MGPRRRLVVVSVCLLALAHPFYAFPHVGQTAQSFTVTGSVSDAPADETVAYASLPESAQDIVDDALDGGEGSYERLYSPSEAYDALQPYEFVRKDGTVYEYRLRGADVMAGPLLILRDLLSGAAGLTLALYGRRRDDGPRATPRAGATAVAAVALGVYSVQVHDALYTPAYVGLWPPTRGIISFAFLSVPIVLVTVTATLLRRG